MTDPVAAFAALYTAHLAAKETTWQAWRTLQAEAEAAVLAAAKAAGVKGKARTDWRTALERVPAAKDIWAGFKARADAMAEAQIDAERAREADLTVAADAVPVGTVPRSPHLRPLEHAAVSSYRYSTQGFGSMKYAQGDAESQADAARAIGIPAEVHLLESRYVPGFGCGTTEGTYIVLADCDPIGWQIAQRRTPLPLREVVRLAWKRGINPRVRMPFLQHGYEESVGLDFFGGERAA